MSENRDVELNNTCEIDELESEIAESESVFSTAADIGRFRDFDENYFGTCLTCNEIDEPSPSFIDTLKNLAVHEKKSRIEIYNLKRENQNLKKQLKTNEDMQAIRKQNKNEEGISRQDSVCKKIIERGQNGYGLKFEARMFIESVLPGCSTGIIEEGNEVLEINGQSVRNLSENEAFDLLESSKKAELKLRKIKST